MGDKVVDDGKQPTQADTHKAQKPADSKGAASKEYGGGKGADPTRYGDWEIGGKCVDF